MKTTTVDRLTLLTGLTVRLVSFALLLAVSKTAWAQSPSGFELLGRGINYGNMLEAPNEGDWGLRFEDDFPRLVKQAGFDSVRVPVRWSAHTDDRPPFRIDSEFLDRVRHIVALSLEQDLKVVLNVHHFEQLYANPEEQKEKFKAIWKQLSEAFRDADSRVFFELLNEPNDKLTAEPWNAMVDELIPEIRKLHPDRWLIVGPDQWNGFHALPRLELPESDRRLIVTVHYYSPFEFTHQGASWSDPIPPVGKLWTGTEDEVEEMANQFAKVAEWSKANQRPIYLGEFGAFEKADMTSRGRWTRQVRSLSEQHGFSWAYWELASGFGALDPQSREWRSTLLNALIQPRN